MRAFVAVAGVSALLFCARIEAGDKAQKVPKDGLKIEGAIAANDGKVSVELLNKDLVAKVYHIEMSASMKYRIAMNKGENETLDSFLVVQDKDGKQLAIDDDSGGSLNALLHFSPPKDGVYKVYAAALSGTGKFTLQITSQERKIHEVGKGLKLEGQISKDARNVGYEIKMTEGKTYVIDMIAADQKDLDPFLRLHDSNGKLIAVDDDGGDGLNARITHKATTSGTYNIIASCVRGEGRFTLEVKEQ